MRIAVEVLVPLRLFVCCFLAKHGIKPLLVQAAAHRPDQSEFLKFQIDRR